jgi:hypothetical protein
MSDFDRPLPPTDEVPVDDDAVLSSAAPATDDPEAPEADALDQAAEVPVPDERR